MASSLLDGLYEELITHRLGEALGALDSLVPARLAERLELAPIDGPLLLSRHVQRELVRALASLKGETAAARATAQVELCNRLVQVIQEAGKSSDGQAVLSPPTVLRAVYRGTPMPRPVAPLATTTLLTRNRAEPELGRELAAEVASADSIDGLISFVTMGGVRLLRESLLGFARRHEGSAAPCLRIMTTTYMGATEAEAVDWLARLPGTRVKVSFDDRRTRLHAKAWLFRRDTGLTTAYVGSANLSNAALTGGHEWMVKIAAHDLPHVIDTFEGAFETLWADSEFEDYDPDDPDLARRLREALGTARSDDSSELPTWFTLRPFPFQEEILERLRAEREVHGRWRNLVVAATGTGKTVVAAFDYLAQVADSGLRPRLLFLAHRRELLVQARATFRHVLQDGAFGSLLTGEDDAAGHDHLFATIQSFHSRELMTRFGGDHWQYVVVDECHHLPARSYRDVVPQLRPRILLGLTATPERSDERSLLPDFDGHIAAELRLWHALERQLLVPFEYFGLADNTDLRQVRWSRQSGYDLADLENLYTGNHVRADLVIAALRQRLADPRHMRALGFCVSVAHAEFMAEHFSKRGIPAVAVHGGSATGLRQEAPRQLERREVNVIFTCDLYNEGVDLPFVDSLLLLRPTSSATLFIQQLGRGLRLYKHKPSCLVLDFIGQHRDEFRFDRVLEALTSIPRSGLKKAAEEDFPFLPSGCSLRLDAQARETILRSLKIALAATHKRLVAELTDLAARQPEKATLAGYLEETGRELSEIYDKGGSWTSLKQHAGLTTTVTSEQVDTCERLGRLLHIDDPERLRRLHAVATDPATSQPLDEAGRRELLMLGYQLVHESKQLMASEEVIPWLHKLPAAAVELGELATVLEDRVPLASKERPVAHWPLVLHRHYSRREIMTACGYWNADRKVPQQQGVLRLKEEQRELLFVTLDKSEGGFSPTTRYRDYAISRSEFHWETQNAVSDDSETARRYFEHVARGWSMFLFVQPRKGEAFAFLGPVSHIRHSGSRPVAIVWQLERPMPATLFQEYATLSSG
jgi:superfamily II DNA or RNA helicase/HKD family nuclease